MKLKSILFFSSLVATTFCSANTARDAFLKQQAYAEMQRVSGEIDVLRQNFSDLESRVRSSNSAKSEIEDLRKELEAVKYAVARLKDEMSNMRSEIVSELSRKIVKVQAETRVESNHKATASSFQYKGETREYEVVSGDTLFVIAKALDTNVALIKKLNNLKSDKLKIGQKLIVPVGK